MNIRKILSVLLIVVLLTGCGKAPGNAPIEEKQADKYAVTVEGAIFAGNADDRIQTEVTFDPNWLTVKDNTKYNRELAQFAAILSDDVYFRAKDLDKGTQNRVLYDGENTEEYDWTAFLKKVGFSDVRYIESYKEKEYAGDSNDSVTMLLGHTVVDGQYDLYVVAVRGCFSAQEWISVFDPGCDGEAYTELTGQHPEWTDRNAFKGLDIARNRAITFIDEFIEQYDNAEYQNCMLITGHSRGGALANMIGAEMEDRADIRSYAYTFSTPGVTTDAKAMEYRTIFNVYDTNDYYADPLPFGEEQFYRYGCDIAVAVADSEEIKTELARLKGRDDFKSLDAETKAEFVKLFGDRFPNRASLYDMLKVTRIFEKEEDALAFEAQCQALIGSEQGLGLEGLCMAESNGKDGKYEVTLSYGGGAILIAYAKTLAYGQAAYEASVLLFQDDVPACEILSLLMDNAAELSGGHLLINSYVISAFCGQ